MLCSCHFITQISLARWFVVWSYCYSSSFSNSNIHIDTFVSPWSTHIHLWSVSSICSKAANILLVKSWYVEPGSASFSGQWMNSQAPVIPLLEAPLAPTRVRPLLALSLRLTPLVRLQGSPPQPLNSSPGRPPALFGFLVFFEFCNFSFFSFLTFLPLRCVPALCNYSCHSNIPRPQDRKSVV